MIAKHFEAEFDANDGKHKFHVKIDIIHNDVDDVNNAFNSWLVRTDRYTSQSLVDYINSKSHMTLTYAMTKKNWDNLNSKSQTQWIKDKRK